jgi:hypothetical protein
MATPLSRILDELLPVIADQERDHPESYPEKSIRALFDAGIMAGPLRRIWAGGG